MDQRTASDIESGLRGKAILDQGYKEWFRRMEQTYGQTKNLIQILSDNKLSIKAHDFATNTRRLTFT